MKYFLICTVIALTALMARGLQHWSAGQSAAVASGRVEIPTAPVCEPSPTPPTNTGQG